MANRRRVKSVPKIKLVGLGGLDCGQLVLVVLNGALAGARVNHPSINNK